MAEPSTSGNLRPGQALALAGAASGFAIVVFGAGSWAGTAYSNVRTESVIAALIGVLAWLIVALRSPDHRPASQLMGAFAAALVAFGVCAAFAWNVRLGFDYLGYAILLTALYLLLVRLWAVPAQARRLGIIAAVICAVGGVVFIGAIVATWIDLWSVLGRLVIPPLRLTYEGLWLGSPNAFAAFQVLMFLAALPTLLEFGRRGRIVVLLLGALVLIDVLLSASRGAWLGLALAWVTMVGAWLTTPSGRSSVGIVRAVRGRRARVALGGAVAVIVVVGVALGPRLLARLGDFSGADLRTAFLAASLRMFQADPLTGLGPGSWVPARLSFTSASEIDYYIPHAHNVPAQLLAEFGLVGVLAAAVVVAALLWMVVRAIRHSSPAARALGLAALFAAVYLSGQQLVDAFIHQPAVLVALAMPIARLDAWMTSAAPRPVESSRHRGRVLAAVLMCATIVGAGAALWPEHAAQLEERAVTAADAGAWSDAYALSTQAATEDPRLAPYQFLRGLSAAQTGDLAGARDALLAAASLDDYPAAWLDLAAVQVRLGDPAGRSSLDRAVRLGRQQPSIAVAAAQLYLGFGDTAAATGLLAAAFGALPSLAADPLWATPAWSRVANDAISQDLLGLSRWNAMLLALETGRTGAAASIADQLDSGEHDLGVLTVAAWTGDQTAYVRLHDLAKANPLSETTVGLCLRIAQLHDPGGKAPGWTCDGGWWFGIYPIGRVGAAADIGPIAGPEAYPHALYAYRRPGPKELLVPWLLHIHAVIA